MSLPVYLKVDNVEARPLHRYPDYGSEKQTTTEMLLNGTWRGEWRNQGLVQKILQSSFDGKDRSTHHPQRNGLVGTVMDAYARHHHLILRPDDIWIAILTQFNFYVNAHSEELRAKFVAHDGKKELQIEAKHGFDFTFMSKAFADAIHENVVDKDLKDWILPDFSTTTETDTIVSAGIMMATLKSYFEYMGGITCGIPSITLEGTQKDWLQILMRLDRLEDFGLEPTAWAALLRPVLQQFVNAFDGKEDIDFWKRIVRVEEYCGGGDVSGWIGVFGIWSEEGKWTRPALPTGTPSRSDLAAWATMTSGSRQFSMDLNHIPVGFCDVDLLLIDDVIEYPCMIVAGHIATLAEGHTYDTVRPQPGWFMLLKKDHGTLDPEQEERLQKYRNKEPVTRLAESKVISEDGIHTAGCMAIFPRIYSFFKSAPREA